MSNNMLRKHDIEKLKEYISLLKSDKPMPNKLRAQLYRLREKIKNTIEALSFVARSLPEYQRRQVFTRETLKPLIESLFTFEGGQGDRYVTNTRVADIWFMILWVLNDKAEDLIKPGLWNIATKIELNQPFKALRTIWMLR